MTRVQLTGSEWEFVDPYLPIGEYGPYPERLRQQFEGVIWRFKTGGRPWSVRGVEERTAAERRERERADLMEQVIPGAAWASSPRSPRCKYSTLRQATRDDITSWLADRPYRAYDASALRSLFSTLKAKRLIFANPMRGIKGGKVAIKIPASLTADEVESVALAALQDPALRVVVALPGIHALPARQIRSMLVAHVDLPGRRLDPEGLDRPLDNYTAEAIDEYLAYRHRRWPNSTNPHLLFTRNTATTTTAVGTFWMDRLVKELPVGVDQLRQDRILEEALANGADPLHLAHVFSLGAKASLRYTSAVTETEAEWTPTTP